MKTITQDQLDAICKNGRGIDSKGGYPAVVIHPDDTITKLWARKKGLFSSATLWPYSNRFVKNAANLAKRGVVTPEILSHQRLENSHIRLVRYRSLPGSSIREKLESAPESIDMPDLCRFILSLHDKGIQFGGMHLGNIIQMKSGYGLIDFTDVKFYKQPLTPQQRANNLRTPLRYTKDMKAIEQAGLPCLLDSYLTESNFSSQDQDFVRKAASR